MCARAHRQCPKTNNNKNHFFFSLHSIESTQNWQTNHRMTSVQVAYLMVGRPRGSTSLHLHWSWTFLWTRIFLLFLHFQNTKKKKKLNRRYSACVSCSCTTHFLFVSPLPRQSSYNRRTESWKWKKLFRLIITMSAYWHIINKNVSRIEMCWRCWWAFGQIERQQNRKKKNSFVRTIVISWRRRGKPANENKENGMWMRRQQTVELK